MNEKTEGLTFIMYSKRKTLVSVSVDCMRRIRKFFGKQHMEILTVPIEFEQLKDCWRVTIVITTAGSEAPKEKKELSYLAKLASMEYYEQIEKHFNNENYRVGRNFEYRCMKKYRKAGWYTKRSFGSHGTEDFIAFRSGDGHFVQCKFSRNHETRPDHYKEELQKLKDKALNFGGIPVFAGVKKNRRIYFVNLLTNEEFMPR